MKKTMVIVVTVLLLSTAVSSAILIYPAVFPKPQKDRNVTFPAINNSIPEQEYNLTEYQYFQRVRDALLLDNDSISLLGKHGFAVIPDGNATYVNFVKAYKSYYVNDLPVFITTDTILNLFHLLLEKVLESYEEEWIGPSMQRTVFELYNDSLRLFSSNMTDFLTSKRLMAYFTVPNLLFNNNFTYPSEIESYVLPVMQKIKSATDIEGFPGQDYTQYKVRGHYTKTEYLGKYFQAMMWIQKSLFSLEDINDISMIWAISSLMSNNSIASANWERVNTVLEFIVGAQDSMTYKDVQQATWKLFGTTDMVNLSYTNASLLRDELKNGNYTKSKIIKYRENTNEPVTSARLTWSLMGQRYVLDAEIMQNVIADIVPTYNFTNRFLPSGLDVAAALGSDRAEELLIPELVKYNYSTQLANQAAMVKNLAPAFWNLTAYNMLLDSYKPLLVNGSSTPQKWMNSTGWRSEKVNSVLGSYAELKYDTILYAAQPYGGCSYPEGYVEPYPEFYDRMARLCDRMDAMFTRAPLPIAEWITYTIHKDVPTTQIRFHPTFYNLKNICAILANISRTEIAGKNLSSDQINFIKDIVDVTRGRATNSAPPPVGWLTDLLRANLIDEFSTDSRIVTDICSNANAGDNGLVKEIGIGDVQTLVVLITAPNGTKFIAAGPVYSYYEFEQPMTQRMMAEEWRTALTSKQLPRPDWANDFLA